MAEEKDRAQADLQALDLRPGDRFRHYKGGQYEIVNLAVKEDTLEPLVIYRSFTKDYMWARTLLNWNEDVEVNGKKVRRFEKLL